MYRCAAVMLRVRTRIGRGSLLPAKQLRRPRPRADTQESYKRKKTRMTTELPIPPGLTRTQLEAEISALTDADWRRAERISDGLAAGVVGIEPEDLLQEALTKLLEVVRVWPAGVPTLVVLENVMHSIASNTRKRVKEGPIDETTDPLEGEDWEVASAGTTVFSSTANTPEDKLSGKQQIAAVYAALASDTELQDLATAWAMGLRGNDAIEELGWAKDKYEAQRKRLVRRLEKLDPDRSKK